MSDIPRKKVEDLEQTVIFLQDEISRLEKKKAYIEKTSAEYFATTEKEIKDMGDILRRKKEDTQRMEENLLILGKKISYLDEEKSRKTKERDDIDGQIEAKKQEMGKIISDISEQASRNEQEMNDIAAKRSDIYAREKKLAADAQKILEDAADNEKEKGRLAAMASEIEKVRSLHAQKDSLLRSREQSADSKEKAMDGREVSLVAQENKNKQDSGTNERTRSELEGRAVLLLREEEKIAHVKQSLSMDQTEYERKSTDLAEREKEYLLKESELKNRERIVKNRERVVGIE